MKSSQTPRDAARLARAQRRFEAWRARHPPFTRIPDGLWREAVRAAKACGVPRTAQCLRVNYVSLKQRVDASGATNVRPSAKIARPAFIELLPSQLTAQPECVLELEDSRGAKLKIQLKNLPDLAALARSFWSAGS